MSHDIWHGRRGRRGLAFLAASLVVCAATSFGTVGASASVSGAAGSGGGAGAVSGPAPSGGALFDDFACTGADDPAIAAHGWAIRDVAGGGPGATGAAWRPSAVSFPEDASAQGRKAMRLGHAGRHRRRHRPGPDQHPPQAKFCSGTHAARVCFDDQPSAGTAGGENPGAADVEDGRVRVSARTGTLPTGPHPTIVTGLTGDARWGQSDSRPGRRAECRPRSTKWGTVMNKGLTTEAAEAAVRHTRFGKLPEGIHVEDMAVQAEAGPAGEVNASYTPEGQWQFYSCLALDLGL